MFKDIKKKKNYSALNNNLCLIYCSFSTHVKINTFLIEINKMNEHANIYIYI